MNRKHKTFVNKVLDRIDSLNLTRQDFDHICEEAMAEVYGKRWDSYEGKVFYYEYQTSVLFGYYQECYKGSYTTLGEVCDYICEGIGLKIRR